MDWQHFQRWYATVYPSGCELHTLTILDVQAYLRHQQAYLQASTVNRRLGVLKQFLVWAATHQLLPPTLVPKIQSLRLLPTQPLAPQSLEPAVVRKLLRELELSGTVRDQALIYLLLYTGLRVGELAALRLGQITLKPRRGSLLIGADSAKGHKTRLVPIPHPAREKLRDYLAEQPLPDPQALVFRGRQGPLSTAGIAAMLKKYTRRAALPPIHPHQLRHTFAYQYLQSNMNDLVGLAAILGHSDLNTTRMYTQKRLEDLQQGVERVEFY